MSQTKVVVMGRATVDLYANELNTPLSRVSTFTKYLGGCPANFAVGIARLGAKVCFVGKVGDEELGNFVRESLMVEGIDTTYLKIAKGTLTGLTFLEISPPDRFPYIYYRRDCADLKITCEDVPVDELSNAKLFFTSGTGLTEEPSLEATLWALEVASSKGTTCVFDVDFRPSPWKDKMEEIVPCYERAFRLARVVLGTEGEIRISTGEDDLVRAVGRIFDLGLTDTIVIKRGAGGSTVFTKDKQIDVDAFEVEVLNVLGAGDGYAAGFCRGLLDGLPLEDCARLGNAVGAFVVTRHSCASSMPYYSEVQALLKSGIFK